jgi:hypothetical protein
VPRALLAFLVLSSSPSLAAALPPRVHQFLERVRPELSLAIAADAKLLSEVGARSLDELGAATYDFPREVRFYRIDQSRLAAAESLAETLQATNQYCVPYCVTGACKALLCFQYDAETDLTSLLTVGRTDQAQRLQEGTERAKALVPGAELVGVVANGDRELVVVRERKTGEHFLIPATGEHAELLSTAARGRSMDRISLDDARALIGMHGVDLTMTVADDDEEPSDADALEAAAGAHAAPAAPRVLPVAARTASAAGAKVWRALRTPAVAEAATAPVEAVEDAALIMDEETAGDSQLSEDMRALRQHWHTAALAVVALVLVGIRAKLRRRAV